MNSTVPGVAGDGGGLGLGVHAADSLLGDTTPRAGDTMPESLSVKAGTLMGSVRAPRTETNSIVNGSSSPTSAPCSSLLHFHARSSSNTVSRDTNTRFVTGS
jgi:hypothetical protein